MKLKSLLVLASCSALAISLSVPSIAETKKNSQIKSETIGIGNKDFRNKQSTPSIVGNWKSDVNDNEYRSTDPQQIFWDINSNGTTDFAFKRSSQSAYFSETTYEYYSISETKGIWKEKLSSGVIATCSIDWISDNEFVLTVLELPGSPEREGVQRRFVLTKGSVVSSLRSPQPTTTTTDYSGLNNAIDDYNKTRVLNRYRLPKY